MKKIILLLGIVVVLAGVASADTDIILDRLNNLGGSDNDWFRSVIDSGDYYIAVGHSDSDLSGLPGGSGNYGLHDFVIAKFLKSDLSLVSINNLGGILIILSQLLILVTIMLLLVILIHICQVCLAEAVIMVFMILLLLNF